MNPNGDGTQNSPYRQLVFASQDAMLLAQQGTGTIEDANPAAMELFGRDRVELLSTNWRELFAGPETPVVQGLEQALEAAGRAWHPQVEMVTRSGRVFWGEVQITGFVAAGRALYGIVAREVSRRVERERELSRSYAQLQETQIRLVEAAKLSVMGQLGAGVAHELNQPLTAIRGFTDRILRSPEQPVADFVAELEVIQGETLRMGRIIDSVRTYARQGTHHQPAVMLPMDPLEDALLLIGQQLQRREVAVSVDIEPGLPPLHADRARLQQVFINLLSNARDALADVADRGREIRVRVGRSDLGVCYAIDDNGPGIPGDRFDAVFEPFYTTKPPGQGTGLGLSIAYGIVRDHGGTIRAERSTIGGARFSFEIPIDGSDGTVRDQP